MENSGIMSLTHANNQGEKRQRREPLNLLAANESQESGDIRGKMRFCAMGSFEDWLVAEQELSVAAARQESVFDERSHR